MDLQRYYHGVYGFKRSGAILAAPTPASAAKEAAGKPRDNGFDLKREPTAKPCFAPGSTIVALIPAEGLNISFNLPATPKFCE